MKKYINLAGILLVIAMSAVSLWGQITGIVTGTATDQNGKPIVGATVEMVNIRTGTKYQLKTNSKGQYYSVGIALGTYTVTLVQNGAVLEERGNAVIEASGERLVDFDLAKDPATNAEQQQKAAAAQKSSEKIKGLNASLKQAKDLEGAGNYDQAITLLQQATQVDPSQDLVWGYLGDAQRGAAAHATDPAAAPRATRTPSSRIRRRLRSSPPRDPTWRSLPTPTPTPDRRTKRWSNTPRRRRLTRRTPAPTTTTKAWYSPIPASRTKRSPPWIRPCKPIQTGPMPTT